MSASDELTIWILSTARNAPSAAPTTASQVLNVTLASRSILSLACCGVLIGVASRCAVAMRSSRRPMADMARPRFVDGSALIALARGCRADEAGAARVLGQDGRLGVDLGLDRHACPQ